MKSRSKLILKNIIFFNLKLTGLKLGFNIGTPLRVEGAATQE